jgi:hypothetical protein
MIQDVGAILIVLLIFGSLVAVVSYYFLDRSRTLRERPFMRLIRTSLEAADTALSDGFRIVGWIMLLLCIAILGLIVVGAVVKWAFEELAR